MRLHQRAEWAITAMADRSPEQGSVKPELALAESIMAGKLKFSAFGHQRRLSPGSRLDGLASIRSLADMANQNQHPIDWELLHQKVRARESHIQSTSVVCDICQQPLTLVFDGHEQLSLGETVCVSAS